MRLIVLAIVGLTFGMSLKAQAQPEQVGNVEINVYDRYKASVRSAVKISGQPDFSDSTTKKIPVQYNVKPKVIPSKVEMEPISPALISKTKRDVLPSNLFKVGMGNYTTPEVALLMGNTRNQSFSWSAELRHFSTQTGVTDIPFKDNGMMENDVVLSAKKIYGAYRWTNTLDLRLDQYSYYGVPKGYSFSDSLLGKAPDKQKYFRYGVQSTYEAVSSKAKTDFKKVSFGYYFLHDNYKNNEHYLNVSTAWNHDVQGQSVDLDVDMEYAKWNTQPLDYALFMMRIRPKIEHQIDRVHFTFGLNFVPVVRTNGVNTTDSLGNITTVSQGESRYYFYPDIRAELPLVKEVLNVYAGWTGDVRLNTIDKMSLENPYMNPGVAIRESGIQQVYAGFSGKISKSIGFNAKFRYVSVTYMPLYYRSPVNYFNGTGANGFDVIFSDVNIMNPRLELLYANNKNLEVRLYGDYFSYDRRDPNNNPLSVYHKPNYKAGLNTTYTWAQKIKAQVDFAMVGQRVAFEESEYPTESNVLSAYPDLRIGLEYYYNSYLSAYLNVTNTLAQDYDLWFGYPTQRTRFILGLAYKF